MSDGREEPVAEDETGVETESAPEEEPPPGPPSWGLVATMVGLLVMAGLIPLIPVYGPHAEARLSALGVLLVLLVLASLGFSMVLLGRRNKVDRYSALVVLAIVCAAVAYAEAHRPPGTPPSATNRLEREARPVPGIC